MTVDLMAAACCFIIAFATSPALMMPCRRVRHVHSSQTIMRVVMILLMVSVFITVRRECGDPTRASVLHLD